MKSLDFNRAFDEGDEIEFSGYRLDEPNYDALVVTEENYLEQLRVHAAGLAYYGTLAKKTERYCDEIEKRYRAKYNDFYQECSDILSRTGKKSGAKDVESFVRTKYGDELKKWEDQIAEAQDRKDGTIAYYEAWKAKGYAISSMTSLITAGLLTPRTTITAGDVDRMSERRMNCRRANDILLKKNS